MSSLGLTALVLAGTRAEGDPLAAYAHVTHKALIEVGGRAMIERVVGALAASPEISRILVAIERPDIVKRLPACPKPLLSMEAAAGPSASVAAALQAYGTPLLITTADHALLQSAWIAEFLARSPLNADAIVAFARREAIEKAAPDTERTYLRFSDGDVSGCNLFLLRSPASDGIVRLWREVESDRKRPLALLSRLGLSYVSRYKLGYLSLDQALARLGTLSATRLAYVLLSDGRAAIDVDKPHDLDLVRRLDTEEGP